MHTYMRVSTRGHVVRQLGTDTNCLQLATQWLITVESKACVYQGVRAFEMSLHELCYSFRKDVLLFLVASRQGRANRCRRRC